MHKAIPLITVTAFADEALGAIHDLRWMLVCIIVLIATDFWYGVADSLKKHQEFRFSRAGRRTTAKFIEYLTYLIVGCVVGLAIFEPLGWMTHTGTAALALLLAFIWELDSIASHVCSLHRLHVRFSFKRFIISLLKAKDKAIGTAVEEGMKER